MAGRDGAPNLETSERPKRALDQALLEATHDEHEARAPVVVGPAGEVGGRMDDVLDAMDHDRRRHIKDVQYPLDAQHIVPMDVEQHGEPDAESRPVQRLLEDQAEGVDVTSVP